MLLASLPLEQALIHAAVSSGAAELREGVRVTGTANGYYFAEILIVACILYPCQYRAECDSEEYLREFGLRCKYSAAVQTYRLWLAAECGCRCATGPFWRRGGSYWPLEEAMWTGRSRAS